MDESLHRAFALYPGKGRNNLRDVAAKVWRANPRVYDYLEQAPVLGVLLAYAEKNRTIGQIVECRDVGALLATLARRNPKLRDLMNCLYASLTDPPITPPCFYTLRRLKGSALREVFYYGVMLLARGFDDPAELAQTIPTGKCHQERWLRSVNSWAETFGRRRRLIDPILLRRFARVAKDNPFSEAAWGQNAADFMMSRDERFWETCAWSERRFTREMTQWEQDAELRRYDNERELHRYDNEKLVRDEFDSFVADYAPLPNDPMTVGKFEIVPLRTFKDLYEEGRAMKHCVADYFGTLRDGGGFFFSARSEGVRRATVWDALEPRPGGVYLLVTQQMRGPRNSIVRDRELLHAISTFRTLCQKRVSDHAKTIRQELSLPKTGAK